MQAYGPNATDPRTDRSPCAAGCEIDQSVATSLAVCFAGRNESRSSIPRLRTLPQCYQRARDIDEGFGHALLFTGGGVAFAPDFDAWGPYGYGARPLLLSGRHRDSTGTPQTMRRLRPPRKGPPGSISQTAPSPIGICQLEASVATNRKRIEIARRGFELAQPTVRRLERS